MYPVSVNDILWPNKCVRNNPSALNSMILLYSVVYICLVLRSRLCSNYWLLLIRYGCTVNLSRTTSLKNISLYVDTLVKNLLIKFLMMLFLVAKGCKFDSCVAEAHQLLMMLLLVAKGCKFDSCIAEAHQLKIWVNLRKIVVWRWLVLYVIFSGAYYWYNLLTLGVQP